MLCFALPLPAGVLCDRSGGVRALWGSYSEQISKEEQEWTAGEPHAARGWVACNMGIMPMPLIMPMLVLLPCMDATLRAAPCSAQCLLWAQPAPLSHLHAPLTCPQPGLPAAAFAPWVKRLVAEHARQQSSAAPPREAAAGPAAAEAAAAGQAGGGGAPSSGTSDAGSDGSGSSGGGSGSGGGAADQEHEPVPLPPPQVCDAARSAWHGNKEAAQVLPSLETLGFAPRCWLTGQPGRAP